MKTLKCEKCGKSLLKIEYGNIEIKCPRCGYIVKVKITSNRHDEIGKVTDL